MRVIGKFAVLYIVASYLVMAGLSYMTAHSEVERFEQTATADLMTAGTAIALAVTSTSEAAGEEAAQRVLRSLAAAQDELEVRWIAPDAGTPSQQPGSRRAHREVSGIFMVGTPMRPQGHIVVSRRVPSEGEILSERLATELLSALMLAILGGGLAVLVGATVIGRPLERIVAQARRIGAGDFSQRLRSTGKDEIGVLKRELNSMCDQLKTARTKLDEETAAKTSALEQLRHLDRLRMVGTLASSIGHELGTPMNVVLIQAQSLASLDTADASIREAGTMISRQVDRMTRIVRQMLDFSRRESPRLHRVALSSVAETAVSLVAPIAKRSGVALVLDATEPSHVLCAAAQLEQALTNLIVNAIHATPEGGRIVVRLSRCADARPPGSARVLEAALVEVEDTGSGLTPEELSRVFLPFYTSRPPGLGTGLGLTVAAGIAEDHGGWLSAKSTPQVGSTFTLWLPEAP